MQVQPLFNVSFLASKWEAEYQAFKEPNEARNLLDRLQSWAARCQLKETATEAAFIKVFFYDIWEYAQQGDSSDGLYQCYPQFPIARADQSGGTGAFLIQTLEYLKREHRWVIEERVRITGQEELWDVEQVINAILANNNLMFFEQSEIEMRV